MEDKRHQSQPVKIGVVISAYNNWDQLRFVLRGYQLQDMPPAEILIAEDSEFPEIAEMVKEFGQQSGIPIVHVRQRDDGFRKCRILNEAIRVSTSDFLVFTDADVIPRKDVIRVFANLAKPGRFVAAGSHLNLPEPFHLTELSMDDIDTQRIFDPAYLVRKGIRLPPSRLLEFGRVSRFLDVLTQRDAFVGNLSGAWRSDLLRVGGFDEKMTYGGLDRNLGIRMNNAGIKGRRARHSLVCVHLDHPRPYRQDNRVEANKAWNESLKRSGTVLPRESLLLGS